MALRLSVGYGDLFKTEIPPTKPLAVTEIDYILYSAQGWLHQERRDIWVCLDSLDEVTLNGGKQSEAEELLSDLMRAVGEMGRLNRIKFKLFFRTDIYNALTYVNKDHFSSVKLELKWSLEDLAILLGYRLKAADEGEQPITYPVARRWIDEVFAWNGSGCGGFDILFAQFTDGNGDVLPRDLIHFCLDAQRAQQAYNIQGINPAPEGRLIGPHAIDTAIRETAVAKRTDFLQVFKNFDKTFDQLKGHGSRRFTRQELIQALSIVDEIDAQLKIADLVRVGAIAIKDKKAVNHSDSFEIPYLYSLALEIEDMS
jgi:hypothetical protein